MHGLNSSNILYTELEAKIECLYHVLGLLFPYTYCILCPDYRKIFQCFCTQHYDWKVVGIFSFGSYEYYLSLGLPVEWEIFCCLYLKVCASLRVTNIYFLFLAIIYVLTTDHLDKYGKVVPLLLSRTPLYSLALTVCTDLNGVWLQALINSSDFILHVNTQPWYDKTRNARWPQGQRWSVERWGGGGACLRGERGDARRGPNI